MDVRYRRSNNKLRNTLPTLDEADDLAAVRDNFREWIVNDGADVSMSKLSNGFVLPPPTISASPTFLVKRTEKEKGMGFYPIYSTYKNSGSRVFTTVKVHGNVLDFIASLHTLVVIPSEESGVTERLKDLGGKEDFLTDVRPAAGGGWKVVVRGKWKRQIEEMLWGMGM